MKIIIDFNDDVAEKVITTLLKDIDANDVKELDVEGKIFSCEIDSEKSSLLDKKTKILRWRVDAPVKFGLQLGPKATVDQQDANFQVFKEIVPFVGKDAQTLDLNIKGSNINVYLVDSGIANNISEFVSSNIENVWSLTNDYLDDISHGTQMAVGISGETLGFSNASLKNCKLFSNNKQTYVSDILDCIKAIISHKRANSSIDQVDVINCSWHIPFDETVAKVFQRAYENRLITVAAGGQTNESCDVFLPSGLSTSLTISSYNPSTKEPITNANWGQSIDYFMPGSNIKVQSEQGQFQTVTGTSISASIASASLANFLSFKLFNAFDDLSMKDIFEICNRQNIFHNQLSLKDNFVNVKNRIFPNPILNRRAEFLQSTNYILGIFEQDEQVEKKLFFVDDVVDVKVQNLPNGFQIENGILTGKFTSVIEPFIAYFSLEIINDKGSNKGFFEIVAIPKNHNKDPEQLNRQLNEEIAYPNSSNRIATYTLSLGDDDGITDKE